jgi:hypothetical protein
MRHVSLCLHGLATSGAAEGAVDGWALDDESVEVGTGVAAPPDTTGMNLILSRRYRSEIMQDTFSISAHGERSEVKSRDLRKNVEKQNVRVNAASSHTHSRALKHACTLAKV